MTEPLNTTKFGVPCLSFRRGQLPQVDEPQRAAQRVVARHLEADVPGAEDDAPDQQGGDGAQAHASRRRRRQVKKKESVLCIFYLNFRILAS